MSTDIESGNLYGNHRRLSFKVGNLYRAHTKKITHDYLCEFVPTSDGIYILRYYKMGSMDSRGWTSGLLQPNYKQYSVQLLTNEENQSDSINIRDNSLEHDYPDSSDIFSVANPKLSLKDYENPPSYEELKAQKDIPNSIRTMYLAKSFGIGESMKTFGEFITEKIGIRFDAREEETFVPNKIFYKDIDPSRNEWDIKVGTLLMVNDDEPVYGFVTIRYMDETNLKVAFLQKTYYRSCVRSLTKQELNSPEVKHFISAAISKKYNV